MDASDKAIVKRVRFADADQILDNPNAPTAHIRHVEDIPQNEPQYETPDEHVDPAYDEVDDVPSHNFGGRPQPREHWKAALTVFACLSTTMVVAWASSFAL